MEVTLHLDTRCGNMVPTAPRYQQDALLRNLRTIRNHTKEVCRSVRQLLLLPSFASSIEIRKNTNHDSFRTSQETQYLFDTDTSRLMLFGEIVTDYCENHTEHINTR
jgi:hypothetical protein